MKRLLLLWPLVLLAACAPRATGTNPVPFTDYVAMGDSITAGFQSGGLTAASQRDSYARLLAERAGLDFPMPEVQDPGCPPPIGSGEAEPNCAPRDPGVVSPDVAVPGAHAQDVLDTTDAHAEHPDPLLYDPRLYRLILGPNTTQMQAALARHPKFVTLWIGSNDVLLPTLRGRPDQATSPEVFRASYARILDRLQESGAKVVALTVPDVTRVPALIPARLLRLAGVADASCDGANVFFGSLSLNGASREKPLSCNSDAALTQEELARSQALVRDYNASIQELAAARGMAVFDVNPFLGELRGRPLFPRPEAPFGVSFSKDGIHPSSSTHRRLAFELARFINRAYGTDIRTW